MSFSTIGTGTSGGSAQQVNFSITANASQTISALYLANSLVDVAGLLVAVQNTGASAITLTATGGSINNYLSWTSIAGTNNVTVQPNQTVVLETHLANLQYFIVDYTQIPSVYGGTAGQLLYQSAPNTTGFVPTGTAGYMLTSNGTSAPSFNPVSVPSIAGGSAGQVLYQSSPGVTAFTATGTTGQFLVSNGSSAPSWMTLAAGRGTSISKVGSTTTINNTRSYTFALSPYSSGSTISTILNSAGITDVAGATYSLYNNTSSNFTINFLSIQNAISWVGNGYFLNGTTQLIIYPNQTVNIYTLTVGGTYGIMSTTQTQSVGFEAQMGASGSLPASTDIVMNFVKVVDPWGAFDDVNHNFLVPKEGFYLFQAQNTFGATGTAFTANIQITKNGTSQAIGFASNWNTSQPTSLQLSTALFCNINDVIKVTNWISVGGVTVLTGTNTNFSGMLVK